jgi:hypothetical protein
MKLKKISYLTLVNAINLDIRKTYGDEFSFELKHEKNYIQLITEKKLFNYVCEYGIIRTPRVYDFSVIPTIQKNIISLFEMFYLCCFEIRTKVELEIKIIAQLP